MEWASTITTIGLEYTVPILLGYALDRWWSTLPVATMAGVVVGLALGMVHTVRLARLTPGGARKHRDQPQRDAAPPEAGQDDPRRS